MKTFNVGTGGNQISFDIQRYVRQPLGVDEWIHWFLVKLRFGGIDIDLYPNQGGLTDPEWFGFQGKRVLPVYENQGTVDEPVWVPVGTKPGGDFRSRFFRQVVIRGARAVRAKQLGKTIGQLTDADIASASAALRNLCNGSFTEPADLKVMGLDDAANFLRDDTGAITEGPR